MDVKTTVKWVGSKFEYLADKRTVIGDWWYVMPSKNGVVRGDCEDFALTCIWEICDRNLLLFILNVFILHRYRLYLTITNKGERHIVGYARGLWFDNWTKEAFTKGLFFNKTKHTLKYFYLSPWIMFFMLMGLTVRNKSIK